MAQVFLAGPNYVQENNLMNLIINFGKKRRRWKRNKEKGDHKVINGIVNVGIRSAQSVDTVVSFPQPKPHDFSMHV